MIDNLKQDSDKDLIFGFSSDCPDKFYPESYFINAYFEGAFNALSEGLRQPPRRLLLLTGETGIGKTLLLHRIMDSFGEDTGLVFCPSAAMDCDQLLSVIREKLKLPPRPDRMSQLTALTDYLALARRYGRRTVLIIDNAHELHEDVLKEVLDLAQTGLDDRYPLQILLSGLTVLKRRLVQQRTHYPFIDETVFARLVPLSDVEVPVFINCQLQAPNNPYDVVFPAAAIERITRHSHGVPGLINTLCHQALKAARSKGEKRVSADTIDEVAGRILIQDTVEQPAPEVIPAPAATAAAVALKPPPTANALSGSAETATVAELTAAVKQKTIPAGDSATNTELPADLAQLVAQLSKIAQHDGGANAGVMTAAKRPASPSRQSLLMVLLLGLVAGAAGGVGSLLLYERSDAVREKIAGLGSLLPQQNQSADDPVFFLAENNLIPENNNSEPAQETAVAGVTGPVASSDPVAVAEPADKAAGSAKTKTDPAAEAVITDADEATEEVFAAVTEPAGDTQTYPLISALPPPAKPSTMQMTPEITPEQPQSPAADIAGEASAAVTPPLLPAPVQAETAASTPQLLDPAVIEGMAAWLQTIRTNLVLPSFVKKPVEPLTAAADEPAEPETAVTDEPPVPSVRQTAAIDEPAVPQTATVSPVPVPVPALAMTDPPASAATLAETELTRDEPAPATASESVAAENPARAGTSEVSDTSIDVDFYVQRGDAMLKLGDVASARLFYQAGAKAGAISCLTSIGITYDPLALEQRGLTAIYADSGLAIQWYEKAHQAGDQQALTRLNKLRSWLSDSTSVNQSVVQSRY